MKFWKSCVCMCCQLGIIEGFVLRVQAVVVLGWNKENINHDKDSEEGFIQS